jgi:hypothetical protein
VARTFSDEPQRRKPAQVKLCETQCEMLHIQPAPSVLALSTTCITYHGGTGVDSGFDCGSLGD